MDYGGDALPEIVLAGLERGESKLARWGLVGTFVLYGSLAVVFFVTPEPLDEKLPMVPWVLGTFAIMAGLFWFASRKYLRVHRSPLARVLRDSPQDIVDIRAEIHVPKGNSVSRIQVPFDGEREFVPREESFIRILIFFRMHPRVWIYLKIKGKLLRRKMAIPLHRSPELLSWLFATMAHANPSCVWGKQRIDSLIGPNP